MKNERFEMRASADFLKKLDDWRRQQPDLPPRSEAIRRIVDQALSSDEAQAPTLFSLIQRFLEADPKRIGQYNGGDDDMVSPAEVARYLVFEDRDYASPGPTAAVLAGYFEHQTDPIAQEIVKLLKRIAAAE